MRRYGAIALATLLFLLVDVEGSVPLVDAKESYRDEVGRVIYTIDDEGIVSMFENSPTDLTMSVTRGTREEMKPLVTEITPESVQAGAYIVLKLKGRNLVGASVKLSAPGIELGPYAGKPQSLDLPIRVRANVTPGDVLLEVATPIGHTEARFRVTDVQTGGGLVKRDSMEKQSVSVVAPTSCPEGMVGVAAERGGFCIEIDQSFRGDIRKAEKTCAATGNRLCTASEWRTACERASADSLPVKNMIGDWEWTGTQIIKELPGVTADYGAAGELNAVLMGQSDCKTTHDYPTWKSEIIAGRCCK